MPSIRRILCPSDFSPASRAALEVSLVVARGQGGHVRAIHVLSTALPDAERGGGSTARRLAADDAAVRSLDELSRLVEGVRGVMADAAVLEGDVAGEILREAREWPADVVVMGGRSDTAVQEWAVGSVTERVLRRAPCPVLAVPRPGRARRPPPAAPFERILCPFDFSELSERSLAYAVALAGGGGARLILLHVLEWFPEEIPHGVVNVPEYRLDLSGSARERLRCAVPDQARHSCPTEEVVTAGRPHRQILRVAEERSADLIVIGLHGRRALDRSLLGATVCHVVREAGCPVLAVPAGME